MGSDLQPVSWERRDRRVKVLSYCVWTVRCWSSPDRVSHFTIHLNPKPDLSVSCEYTTSWVSYITSDFLIKVHHRLPWLRQRLLLFGLPMALLIDETPKWEGNSKFNCLHLLYVARRRTVVRLKQDKAVEPPRPLYRFHSLIDEHSPSLERFQVPVTSCSLARFVVCFVSLFS